MADDNTRCLQNQINMLQDMIEKKKASTGSAIYAAPRGARSRQIYNNQRKYTSKHSSRVFVNLNIRENRSSIATSRRSHHSPSVLRRSTAAGVSHSGRIAGGMYPYHATSTSWRSVDRTTSSSSTASTSWRSVDRTTSSTNAASTCGRSVDRTTSSTNAASTSWRSVDRTTSSTNAASTSGWNIDRTTSSTNAASTCGRSVDRTTSSTNAASTCGRSVDRTTSSTNAASTSWRSVDRTTSSTNAASTSGWNIDRTTSSTNAASTSGRSVGATISSSTSGPAVHAVASVYINPTFQAPTGPPVTSAPSSSAGPSRATLNPSTARTSRATLNPSTAGPSRVVVNPSTARTSRATLNPSTAGTSRATLNPSTAGTSRAVLNPSTAGTSRATLNPSTAGTSRATLNPSTAGTSRAVVNASTAGLSQFSVLSNRKLVRRNSSKSHPRPAVGTPQFRLISNRKLVRHGVTAGSARRAATGVTSPQHRLVSSRKLVVRRSAVRKRRSPARRGSSYSWIRGKTTAGGAVRVKSAVSNVTATRYRLVRTGSQYRSSGTRGKWPRPEAYTPNGRSVAGQFVDISGLVYRTSTRKLQRASPTSSSNSTHIVVLGCRYRLETGAGGTAVRLVPVDSGAAIPVRLQLAGVTFHRQTDNSLVPDTRANINRAAASRAVSRSRSVLRRRVAAPCPFYCRLGRCLRHRRLPGSCPYLHDPALRPLCSRLLTEAGCQLPSCSYNHQPRREKLPVCIHFLERECHRPSCPYLHVRVDQQAPLCTSFLAGYCPLADRCMDKHLYLCAEFWSSGVCSRRKTCPLAHKQQRHPRRGATAATATKRPAASAARYYQTRLPVGCSEQNTSHLHDSSSDIIDDVTPSSMAVMTSFVALDDSSSDGQ